MSAGECYLKVDYEIIGSREAVEHVINGHNMIVTNALML